MDLATTIKKTVKGLMPELRFGEFKGDWAVHTFGKYVLNSAFGPRFSSNLYNSEGNIATLRTTDMDLEGNICYETMPFANIKKQEIEDHILEENDIVISRSGTIGITGIFKNFPFPVVPGAFLIRFRIDEKSVNSEFIKYKFNSPLGRHMLSSLSAGGVQKNLTGTSVKQAEFITPTLPEQQKIATFLTTVDEKIYLLKTQKSELERYKKGVMQKIFSQELRFRDENGKEFPKWEKRSLGAISSVQKGEQLNAEFLTETGKYPCLNGGISFSGFTDNYNRNKNTITISEGGNSCGYVNYLKVDFWCGGHCYTIDNLEINDLYLFQYLKAFEINIMRLRVGSGLPNIQKKDLLKFPVLLPSPNEQTKIANFLSALDEKIALVGEQIAKMEVWKKGLLQQMFV